MYESVGKTWAGIALAVSLICSATACRDSARRKDAGTKPRDAATHVVPDAVVRDSAPSATVIFPDSAPSATAAPRDAGIIRFDDGNWSAVSEANFYGDQCRVYSARNVESWPALQWVEAGPGRETAALLQGGAERVITSGASRRDGVAYGFFQDARGTGHSTQGVQRLVRLRDGKVVAALGREFTGEVCLDSFQRQTALAMFHRAGPTGAAKVAYAIANEQVTGWLWAPAIPLDASPKGLVEFDTSTHVVSLGKGSVDVIAPSKGSWQQIESASASLYGAGEGNLAVWVESGSLRLRGWSADEGVRTLVDPIPKTCTIGTGGGKVVGVATQGCLGATSSVQVWFVEAGETGTAVKTSPVVQRPLYLAVPDSIRTNGHFAVIRLIKGDLVTQRPQGEPFFWVIELSTWRAWQVERTEPYAIAQSAWTLDDEFLYWAESRDPLNEPLLAQRMTRISLRALDTVGTAVKIQ